MKVAMLTGIRRIELTETEAPTLRNSDDVLLAVRTVGVCGSDMHYYRDGRIGSQIIEFPWSVGHECSTEVVEVGSDVDDLAPGDPVAVDPLINCGRCDQCRSGRIHTCRDQAFLGCPGQAPGCLAERIVMPRRCCFKTPAQMSMTRATLVEPFSIALWAVKLAKLADGMKLGIIGAGPIGLSVLAAAKAAVDCVVFQSDLRDNRVTLATAMGAEWTCNAGRTPTGEAILEEQPLGLDVVFECAGQQEAIDQALLACKPGGMLVIVGIPETDRISMDFNHLRRKEITAQPVRRQNECVEEAIELVHTGKVDLDPMVTHHYDLEQTPEAFDTIADYKDDAVKAMIHVRQD